MRPTTTQDDARLARVEAALAAWDLGAIREIQPITQGLIHETYRVVTDQGAFALQALHEKLSSDAILADWEAVCTWLAAKGVPAPRPLPTAPGARPWIELSGRRWRLATWLDGETIDQVADPHQAREAATLFGRFYRAMQDIPHPFQSSHPLHDTPFHLHALEQALADLESGETALETPEQAGEVRGLARACLEAGRRLSLPTGLPRWVVHGDPKISNLLFRKGRAHAVLDLDTAGPHSILVDLGDALRSWAMDGPEDACLGVRMDVVESAIEGWRDSGLSLSAEEITLLAQAPALITWELAARFTRDAMEDSYFGWDETRYPNRRAHNLARAESMVRLARAFETRRRELAALAHRLLRGELVP